MKKYLIAGCAGFIGSNFVYYMLKKYDDILLVNLDKLTYAGNLENLKGVERYTLSDGTVLNLSEKDQKWLGIKDTFKF